VLALLTIENGVMLAAVALTTYGMPLVVECGNIRGLHYPSRAHQQTQQRGCGGCGED
jgi:hypothetical protein